MKVACLADTHGMLPNTVPDDADLLVIAGDFIPGGLHEYAVENWLLDHFEPWLQRQPGHVVGICGNHEFVGERPSGDRTLRSLSWKYLNHEAATVAGVKVFGSPWTPPFMQWAFMAPEERLAMMYGEIPDDTQLLVTHGPPHGIMDPGFRDPHVGSTALAERIGFDLPDLRLHVFGHLHSGRGVLDRNRVTYVNAAYVDEGYQRQGDAIVVEVDL